MAMRVTWEGWGEPVTEFTVTRREKGEDAEWLQAWPRRAFQAVLPMSVWTLRTRAVITRLWKEVSGISFAFLHSGMKMKSQKSRQGEDNWVNGRECPLGRRQGRLSGEEVPGGWQHQSAFDQKGSLPPAFIV